jgi:hypothetical protein
MRSLQSYITLHPIPLNFLIYDENFIFFLSVYQVGCVCRIPSLYDGDLMQEEEVLLWLIEQKTTDTIEQVTDKVDYLFPSTILQNKLIFNDGRYCPNMNHRHD